MALFSGNLKKMRNELDSGNLDWSRIASLSAGKYDLSGRNSLEGKELVGLLVKLASALTEEVPELSLIIRNIAARGGDFNRSLNETGATPVHIAAGIENGIFLKALLDAGIPPVAPSHSGSTPLHKAVSLGCLGNVRLLLAAGADPGAEDSLSNSPLHLAAQMNDASEITEALLNAGAKAYQRNSRGRRPVDLAQDKGCEKCISLLRESLRNIRKSRKTDWKCPNCGSPIKRPPSDRIEWYMGIDMWEYLRFTCGSCGGTATAPSLDGEV